MTNDAIPYEFLDILGQFVQRIEEPNVNIHVRGCPANVGKAEVKVATKFFMDKLLGRLADRVTVFIKVATDEALQKEYASKPIDTDGQTAVEGFCTWIDSNYRPREFEIYLNANLTYNQFLTCLAHELVHVKQFAKGELMDYVSGDVKWHGKRMEEHSDQYHDFPWEIEARAFERVMFQLYKKEVVSSGS